MKITTAIGTGLTLSFLMMNAYATENWAGAYFGLDFGSGGGSVDTSYSPEFQSFEVDTTSDSVVTYSSNTIGHGNLSGNINGSLADLFVGYNFHLNSLPSFIFGGQLEGTFFSNINYNVNGLVDTAANFVQTAMPGDFVNASSTLSSALYQTGDELQSMFTFLVRGGYLLQPNLLMYVLGGGVEGNFVFPTGQDYIIGSVKTIWELGYTVGAGLEYRFNDNWSMRGEYRFIHFDVSRSGSNPTNDANSDGVTTRISSDLTSRTIDSDVDFNMGKVAIVYRFDSPRASFK